MKKNQVAVIGLIGDSIFMEVEEFPKSGETIKAKHVFTEIGGKGFNQALAARRMNANVCFLSAVGKDNAGKKAKDALFEADIKPLLVEKDKQTALACILTDALGNNQVIVANEAINEFQEQDLLNFDNEIKYSKVLLLQGEIPYEINKKAIKIAKKENTLIIYNPAPARIADLEFCKDVYLFTPNELEATVLFGSNWEEDIPRFCQINHVNILVTRGKKGAVLYTDGSELEFPAIKTNAVDTTGAGDAFHGAIAACIAANQSLEESIKTAIIASGISVQKPGIIESYPYYEEVIAYKKSR